jgi:hypothetical protein
LENDCDFLQLERLSAVHGEESRTHRKVEFATENGGYIVRKEIGKGSEICILLVLLSKPKSYALFIVQIPPS